MLLDRVILIAPRSAAALQDFCKRASKTATSKVKETSLTTNVFMHIWIHTFNKSGVPKTITTPPPARSRASLMKLVTSSSLTWCVCGFGCYQNCVLSFRAAQWITTTSSSWRGLLDAIGWAFFFRKQFLGVGFGWRRIQISICDWFLGNPSLSRNWIWLAPNPNIDLWLVFGKTRHFLGIGFGWRRIQSSICDWFLGKPVAF